MQMEIPMSPGGQKSIRIYKNISSGFMFLKHDKTDKVAAVQYLNQEKQNNIFPEDDSLRLIQGMNQFAETETNLKREVSQLL